MHIFKWWRNEGLEGWDWGCVYYVCGRGGKKREGGGGGGRRLSKRDTHHTNIGMSACLADSLLSPMLLADVVKINTHNATFSVILSCSFSISALTCDVVTLEEPGALQGPMYRSSRKMLDMSTEGQPCLFSLDVLQY